MPSRFVLLVLLTAFTGCAQLGLREMGQASRMEQVPTDTLGSSRPLPTHVVNSPGTEATAKRVALVGQRLIEANPQMGMRPLFMTVGATHSEVFHRGPAAGPAEGTRVFVSEGLVAQCQNDDQLAAVLAYEVACLVSEREALASPAVRQPDRRPPPDVPVGNDGMGPFGPPDGTHLVELAKIDRSRHRPGTPALPPPDPVSLARHYLQQSHRDPSTVDDMLPIIRQAEEVDTVGKLMH